ncbi:MAG: right-handed parallel beta-helix repeat-containing protein, partial [Betaproteobacteria bacterium]|nr:right-handed parallel beta-helix repeat-containing protein [Betaproteobacteria bacterium]
MIKLNPTLQLIIALAGALSDPEPAIAGTTYTASPDNYLARLKMLEPGSHLRLAPGEYKGGLPVQYLRGTAKAPITISGPDSGPRPVFVARPKHNTVSIINSSYVTLRNLDLDGRNLPVDGVKCEGHADWAHHITLDGLRVLGHGNNQQTVGISTKCPAWGWIIRHNIVEGAGTGLYLGNSDGRAPFIGGLIERNLIVDTLGYNLQIKHQESRPALPGMPDGPADTIIRHNVFSKAKGGSSEEMARPNVLVGHWPLTGPGSNDRYLVYGNFFYQNPDESLFQGEGNIALYNNLFVNNFGDAVRIQPHNDTPREVGVFYNTIIAAGAGVRLMRREGDPP